MLPIDLLVALALGIWYIVVSVVIFKHLRIQTALQEKILNEQITQTNALNELIRMSKD